MYRAVTSEQARELERMAIAASGESLEDLMRKAGAALAALAGDVAAGGTVCVVAGSGNNGGDGWVAARLLAETGVAVKVASLAPPERLTGDALSAARLAIDAGVDWRHGDPGAMGDWLGSADLIIDAILGTGAKLPLRSDAAAWADFINNSDSTVISADVPTGVDSDAGAMDAHAVRADITLTFIQPKCGLVLYPGAMCAGQVLVESLGVPGRLAEGLSATEVWGLEEYGALLPAAAADAHKNDRGRVLVIAGSGHFPGAAVLAARGAMRGGAGYVTLAVPEPMVSIAQGHLLAAPVVGLPSGRSRTFASSAAAAAIELAADYDAVVLGPGITLSDGTVAAARTVVSSLNKPLVIDADALNALVDARGLLSARRAPTVLTPHPGELARLMGTSAGAIQSDRLSSSAALATGGCAVVLKGAGTVVSGAGRQVVVTAGTPALATAGTGDVLAGLIGAMLAKGLDPLSAGALGAYLHGRAGQAAAADLTPHCVTAEDVPDYIPDAVAELLGDW